MYFAPHLIHFPSFVMLERLVVFLTPSRRKVLKVEGFCVITPAHMHEQNTDYTPCANMHEIVQNSTNAIMILISHTIV